MDVHEYRVLKHDGTTKRFPVRDGDVSQARLRAALVRRPDDCVVAVTEDAFICVCPQLEDGPARTPELVVAHAQGSRRS